MIKLYHGTTTENLEQILNEGLKPCPNWDSDHIAVISLTISADKALREAFIADKTKAELGEKRKVATGYVAIEVDTDNYQVEQWQVDEWWIKEPVRANDIGPVKSIDYETAARLFAK